MDSGRTETNDDISANETDNLPETDILPAIDDSGETAELESDELGEFDTDESDETAELSSDRAGNTTANADIEDLVLYIASRLVHNPDDVTVESELRGGTVYVSLRVPEEEMGRVIGREGRTAKAIRTLVSIAGSRHNVHARLDIDG